MSKELIEVKSDSFKTKIRDLTIMFIIVMLGSGILFLSFYISYTKFNKKQILTILLFRLQKLLFYDTVYIEKVSREDLWQTNTYLNSIIDNI